MSLMGEGFIGRHGILGDLTRLRDDVERRGVGTMVALRGRRQVGKSTLLERFVASADVPYVYVTGRFGAAQPMQLASAHAALRESARPLADVDLVSTAPPSSWEEWFTRLAVSARSGPIVVVLDEFPWLTDGDRTIEGVLQVVWDRVLERLPILLILVGSDVAMMKRLTDHERPLFGRIRPMAVPALNPAEIEQALPEWTPADVIEAHLVTGGYPRLVADVAAGGFPDIDEYVRGALTDQYSPLLVTARLTLDAEFPSPHDAARVLRAVGASERATPGFNDIVGSLTTEAERTAARTATTRALKILTEVKGLIEREQPALAPRSSKLRRYRISDPYLRFWFRYVDPVLDHIERGRPDVALARFNRDWTSWRGRSVEPLVRKSLYRAAAKDPRLERVDDVAPWWRNATRSTPDAEVDVVASHRGTVRVVGSVKWRRESPIAPQEVAELLAHRELMREASVSGAGDAATAIITPQGLPVDGVDLAFGARDLIDAWRI